MAPSDPLYKILNRRSYLSGYRVASAQVTSTLLTFLLLPGRMTSMTSESELTKRMFSGFRSVCDNLLACKTVPHTHAHTHRQTRPLRNFMTLDSPNDCCYARVVIGSILCDPIQPNLSADWPNPTQPNTTNNLTAWCNQVLSNRALNALKILSNF